MDQLERENPFSNSQKDYTIRLQKEIIKLRQQMKSIWPRTRTIEKFLNGQSKRIKIDGKTRLYTFYMLDLDFSDDGD